jgi:hypothetical protein
LAPLKEIQKVLFERVILPRIWKINRYFILS